MAYSLVHVGDTHTLINIGGTCSSRWNEIYLEGCLIHRLIIGASSGRSLLRYS